MFTRSATLAAAAIGALLAVPPAQAEKIQASECRVISGGEVLSTVYNWPDFTLAKPGKAVLACPFKGSMTSYDVLYYDQDGRQGNQSFKSQVLQFDYYNPGTLDWRGGDIVGCDFRSNLTKGNPIGPATVPCRVTVGPNTFQSFIIELWARTQHPDVRFIGIVTR